MESERNTLSFIYAIVKDCHDDRELSHIVLKLIRDRIRLCHPIIAVEESESKRH